MELKYLSGKHMTMGQVSFNRTFMELKFRSDKYIYIRLSGFNRTFMELKFGKSLRRTRTNQF